MTIIVHYCQKQVSIVGWLQIEVTLLIDSWASNSCIVKVILLIIKIQLNPVYPYQQQPRELKAHLTQSTETIYLKQALSCFYKSYQPQELLKYTWLQQNNYIYCVQMYCWIVAVE
ncbi:Hypothetical_protein [Hexamita inflata]|uniref:Hypothetical_protein n=1 Tax=Hexamita inflata TaxID=28002 RepID=A0AA86N4M2_9EUKA|nr:Hypothetical protein HINF_LOCUS415 [Hexamita inflata]